MADAAAGDEEEITEAIYTKEQIATSQLVISNK
jgi:hypothetical protein